MPDQDERTDRPESEPIAPETKRSLSFERELTPAGLEHEVEQTGRRMRGDVSSAIEEGHRAMEATRPLEQEAGGDPAARVRAEERLTDVGTRMRQLEAESKRAVRSVLPSSRLSKAIGRARGAEPQRVPEVIAPPKEAPPSVSSTQETSASEAASSSVAPTFEEYQRLVTDAQRAVEARVQEARERREGQEAPTAYDPEVQRLERDLRLADVVERLERGDRLEYRDLYQVTGALEGRGWHNVFNKVKEGDAVAVFLVPSGGMHSIKNYNDHLFGMQKTDSIWKQRHYLLAEKLAAAGVENVTHSFKDEFGRIDKEVVADAARRGEVIGRLQNVVKETRQEMTEFITELAIEEEVLAEAERKENLDAFLDFMLGKEAHTLLNGMKEDLLAAKRTFQRLRQDDSEMQERLALLLESGEPDRIAGLGVEQVLLRDQLREAERAYEEQKVRLRKEVLAPALKDPKRGYRVTFGISEVGASEDGGYTAIERTISESMKGAMLARETEEGGREFREGDAAFIVEEEGRLRREMVGKELIDAKGNTYPLFEERPDGYAVMNVDVLRDVRKDVFQVMNTPEQHALLEHVRAYMKTANYLDLIKPFTHNEIAGDPIYGTEHGIADQVKVTASLVERLRTDQNLSEAERREVGAMLRQEGKDRTCTSLMEFNTKAVEIPNCTYLSLDVLDVGPELYQEFSYLLQRVEKGEMTFDEAQLIAGDATTEKMRRFRAEVTRAYQDLTGERLLMDVRGDEVMLAMDTAQVTDEFILKLRQIDLDGAANDGKKAGQVRVVKTVVGEGERASDPEDAERLKKEHLEAKKLANRGVEIAKTIETHARVIKQYVYDLPPSERAMKMEALNELNIAEFAVKQSGSIKDASFELVVNGPDGQPLHLDLLTIQKQLEGIRSGLQVRVQELRQDLLRELQPNYPLVNEGNIAMILRRKHRGPPEVYEAFLKHFS